MFKRVENQDIIEEKLADGTAKRYVKGRLLGKGGFAKCYELTSLQTEKKYAAKVIEKASLQKSKAKEKLTSEIKIHKSLQHEYIVRFQHFFEDAEYVYILLEKCPNQTLNQLLKRRKRLTDIETKYYIRQLAEALLYIQKQKVIHRDLKLGNLFLSDKLEIKIGDFGLATKVAYEGERKKTKCGTPNYIAPEILDDKKSHSYEVDVWSMGVIAYTLLVGKPPFQTNDVKLTYNRIKTCNYSFPESIHIEEDAKKFISKMLQLDPSKRPTMQQILQDAYIDPESIPETLPISSLACPPSSDFIRKYRDIQQSALLASTTLLDQKANAGKISKEKSLKNLKNLNSINSRVQSSQKNLTSANRVMSTANLLTNKQNKNASSVKTIKSKRNEAINSGVKIWVTYFEQNPKYGLCYILNSNSCGFRYNDSTVMISNKKATLLKYIEYDSTTRKLKQQQNQAKMYKAEEAQKLEYKKYKILCHFDKDLKMRKTEVQSRMSNQNRIKIQSLKFRENSLNEMKCYVIRYHRTNKSTIFWFNNNSTQVIFQDSSELLLDDNGVMTYVSKSGDRSYFNEKDKDAQSQDIKKRILHFYSVIQGRLLKRAAENSATQKKDGGNMENGNANQIMATNRNNQKDNRSLRKKSEASENGSVPKYSSLLGQSHKFNQQKGKNSGLMKLKSSSSSSRLELRKDAENRAWIE